MLSEVRESELGYLLHFLPVLLGLQVLHEDLGGPEVFLAHRAGGDGCSTGQLRSTDPDSHWYSQFKPSIRGFFTNKQVVTLCSSVRRCSVMLLV